MPAAVSFAKHKAPGRQTRVAVCSADWARVDASSDLGSRDDRDGSSRSAASSFRPLPSSERANGRANSGRPALSTPTPSFPRARAHDPRHTPLRRRVKTCPPAPLTNL
ncbi:hypothetical protein SVAN01_07403 [Stagonosporopsis vannaccii]|nr:hypothetical protein SVAN01_07403 [Stagonosporopsis vannaccii]